MRRSSLEVGAEPFPGYRLRELRGRGGFAEVWEAKNPEGRLVALKFFTSNKTTTTVKEVRSLTAIQKLTHPHLLHMDQVWSVPGYIVVAMELADGSLLELLDAYQAEFKRPIDGHLLCRYLTQAADGIDFLNARQHHFEGRRVGWQHCDVKPSNILMIGEGVKLADFGLSTPVTATMTPYSASGTLDFAAPEIHRGMLHQNSDQYALAVSYYYLRTACFPFPAPTDGFKRHNSYIRPEPNLTLVNRAERKVLERALTMQPDHRWDNCSEMMKALRDAIDNPNSAGSSSLYSPALVDAS